MSPSLPIIPVANLFFGLVLCVTIALLEATLELALFAIDDVQVVVGQFALLFLHLAFDLFPVSFHTVPIHKALLC